MNTAKTRRITDVVVFCFLGLAYLLLIDSSTILASGGGRVSYYLLTVLAAAVPLGWARPQWAKLAALLAIVISTQLATADHQAGIEHERRIYEIRLKAATCPTPSTRSFGTLGDG